MDLLRLSHKVILGFRYLFVPVPSTVFIMIGVAFSFEWLSHPGPLSYRSMGREELFYIFVFMTVLEFIQLTLGVWSLILLDAFARRLRDYLAAVTVLAGVLCLLPAYLAYLHGDGPSFGALFAQVFLGFGVPLTISYLAAWYLRVLAVGRFGERTDEER